MMRHHLILLPGIACDARLWRAQCGALADIVDASAMVPDGDSMEDMADDILAHAPDQFALAGLSMGGYVALAILRRAPTRVTRVCLANTSARPDSEVQQNGRQALIAEAAETGGFERVAAKLLPLLLHPDRRHDDALRADIIDMMRRNGVQTFIRQQKAAGSRPDSRPGLATIAVPACIIAGRADRVTPPEHAVEMANAIDGASLHVLENCGHLTPMEAPAQVTGIMRAWLADA
jgi:pimeloyl-ACP methyl ester carboxylesterase